MKKHSMTAFLSRFTRESERLQKIEWAKQTERLWKIQRERDSRIAKGAGG